jgi:3-hydroxybutyryl-CoA dehydrogenase
MKIVLKADERQLTELVSNGITKETALLQVQQITEFEQHRDAAAWMVLTEEDAEELESITNGKSPLLLINRVVGTLSGFPENVVRLNGWPGFLAQHTLEASCKNDAIKETAELVFQCFHKSVEWAPDLKGFITPRVISMIINEAYFALGENISTKEEIDIAMKLGTNYPYGPFEWAQKIGTKKIYRLLQALSSEDRRYTPAPLLEQEAIH